MNALKQGRESLDLELSVNFIRKEVVLSCGKRNWMVCGHGTLLALTRAASPGFMRTLGGGGSRNLLEFCCRKTSHLLFFFCPVFSPVPLPSGPQAICWVGQGLQVDPEPPKKEGQKHRLWNLSPPYALGGFLPWWLLSLGTIISLQGTDWKHHLPRMAASSTLQLQSAYSEAAFSALHVSHPRMFILPPSPRESGFLGTCSVQRNEPKSQWWGRSGGGGHFISRI